MTIREDRWRARAPQAAVLASVLLGHLALGLWLMRSQRPESSPDAAMEVFFLPAERPASTAPAPPFPVAPHRAPAARIAPPSRATRSAPPDPAPRARFSPDFADRADKRLLDALRAGARREARGEASVRDFLQHRAEPIPGRAEPFTPSAVVLREKLTPEKIVAMIGSLVGGNYDPCPDTVRRIRDLAARNDPIGDAELSLLIDRERRLRCR